MKTILITGCCGFLGSHLSNFYTKKSFNVIGIDNLLTGKLENIEHLNRFPNFKFYQKDVCKRINIHEKLDFILHFASPASPVDYMKFPIKTLEIGSRGTENILKLGLKNNAKVVVASTSEVYGDPLEHPQNELYFGNVNPIGPRGVYDEAKRFLEAITMAYRNKKNLKIGIVRIFNTYGPNMRIYDGRAIPNFVNQALNNKDITVFGDGSQTRSFCFVNDTIRGINALLEKNYELPVNIGNPVEHSILDLAKLIIQITNSSSKIVFKNLPENDPKVRKPCIKTAKKVLKWSPKINLVDGLKKTIDYYKKNIILKNEK